MYLSIFANSKVLRINRKGGDVPSNPVFSVTFELDGQQFHALNGGPMFKFNEAVSMMVQCDTQDELDTVWEQLLQGGGKAQQCGWLKDKFGLSWQVVPKRLGELLQDPDVEKTSRVMQSLMQMTKLDIAVLQAAFDNQSS